jgi:hypothetical protein
MMLVAPGIGYCSFSYIRSPKLISVTVFGAIPDDGENDAVPLRKAMAYCKKNPGTTLFFSPGVYNFRDENAVRLMNDAMSGKLGKNPQEKIFTPYYPYVKGLDFDGQSHTTIAANGATLLCDKIDQKNDWRLQCLINSIYL